MKTNVRLSLRPAVWPALQTGIAVRAIALSAILISPEIFAREQVSVSITGLEEEPLANVRASLQIQTQSKDEDLQSATIADLHANAKKEVKEALQPFGYYRPSINAELYEPDNDVSPWRASYAIDPGPQVPIDTVDVQLSGPGGNDTDLISLIDALPLRHQAALDHRHYAIAKEALLKQTKALGYLEAHYTLHTVEVDMASYSAAISLHLDTGPRYVFGPIEFQQQQFSQDYLDHYLTLKPGEPFRQSEIARQRAALSKSGHFQEVAIELGEPSTDAQPAIPLSIALIPYVPNRYRARLGWGSDTGFGVGADWTRRYLGSNGHHFNLGGALVEERNRLAVDLSYMIPLNPLSGHSIELTARHESKDLTFEDVDLDEGGETRIATNLASMFWHLPYKKLGSFDLERKAGLSLVGESYDVFEVLFGNLSTEAQDSIIDIIGDEEYETLAPDFEAVVPVARLALSRSDDPLYIRSGDYYSLELLGADESMGSNISFWQARLNTWNIRPAGNNGRLLLRTSLGYSDAQSRTTLGVNFNQMPEYYEFRAGGARSVRGYGFETLFPGDAITGGKHLAVASIEYEHEIIPDWSAAIFLDGGNAFNDWDQIDEKMGAGIGVRWRSPVGVARVDLGFPLDDADDAFQIYITVGPEF